MVLFLGLEVYHLATGGSVISFGGLILAALSIMAITAVILNQGDRYRIDETGIHYSNPLLARVGIRLDRRVIWSEVVSWRAHRSLNHGTHEEQPSALLLTLESGPRFVIDSVEEIEEVRQLISQHLNSEAASR